MKIRKSRVYTAHIYELQYILQEVSPTGEYKCVYELKNKNNIVIKFGDFYVPIQYCSNALQYFDIRVKARLDDERLLKEGPLAANSKKLYLKNPELMFTKGGKVSLKDLAELQQENDNEKGLNK